MEDKIYCEACQDLREKDPNLVANGFTDHNCESLSHDLGLNFDGDVTEYDEHTWDTDDESVRNKDCEDLNMLNDCLIGSMADEAEVTDQCAWRDYMKTFGANLWTMFKSLICSICGIWENVWKIWNEIHRIYCIIDFMQQGTEFNIGEEESDGSYIVAGKGISFLEPVGGNPDVDDIQLQYIAGGLMTGKGSLAWHRTDFQDDGECWNFDNGAVIRKSRSRKGNPIFGDTGKPTQWGELIYEIRVKKSQYPQVHKLYAGMGMEQAGGAYRTRLIVFEEGKYAFGNHGHCNVDTGVPIGDGDAGHIVEPGYTYVQLRLSWADRPFTDGGQYTPFFMMGVKMNPNEILCD